MADPVPHATSRSPDRVSLRLFLALWPGPAVRRALAACRDASPWPATASPVASRQLHLTLHFIGQVPADRVGELSAALRVPTRRFALNFGQPACWPDGLAVLLPLQVPAALLRLHDDLAARLRASALPVEDRAFRPHVTLARRSAGMPPVAPVTPLCWRVNGHALVQSMPDGRYVVLHRYA